MRHLSSTLLLTVLLTFAGTSFSLVAQETSESPEIQMEQPSEARAGSEENHKGEDLPYWTVIPFIFILLSIAVLPIASHTTMHWWEDNNNKLIVAIALGACSFFPLVYFGWFHTIVHTIVFEYIPFIVLLGSLYYISGGIVLRGDIEATPLNNTLFLIVGTFLSSFIGTTGASMLLIRPILNTNSERKHVVHTVIFFIFLVSNIGGSLTPLGDPPLFLGYLQGVPFTWTFKLFPEMLLASVILLIIYFIWDSIKYKSEAIKDIKKDKSQIVPISLSGQVNFIWLLGVIFSVAFINKNYFPEIEENHLLGFSREIIMLIMVILSIYTSKKRDREANKFTLHPIAEVAYLFIGIFICMIPALILLESNGKALGITEPWQFFWATGLFSSVLDNAPTYLTFLSLAKGYLGYTTVQQILANPAAEALLKAISVGSVFMGANSYIGNAPNFMVKSVAEENKIKMPSFGAYMLFSFGILFPIFILLTFVFFL